MSQSEHEHTAQIDHCCDLFEKHWGTDKAFSIEDVLSKLPEAQHGAYLKALLPLEIELAGEKAPSAEQLHARFEKLKDVVDAVLSTPLPEDSMAAGSAAQQETIAPRDQTDAEDDVPGSGQMRIPRQLGRYRIVRKLGHGAMGSVFLAHDEQLDRQVALKIPRGDMQRNTELRLRFQREAQAVASLDHPNICRIHDIGEVEGIHYICMGYVEGFPLTRYAIAESGLTEQRIAELVLKLAKALASAHETGFIHRDLKPANVMMDFDEEPVILDFGLARKIQPSKESRVTQTGANIGSPAYMSPEQVDGDQEKIGPSTDIYSLGVILYELLTGRLPFEGSVASVMGQIMMKEPDKPSDFRRDLSVRLEKICLRMMAKSPEKRHPSMHAVVAGLQEYLDKYSPSSPAATVESEDASGRKGEDRRSQIEQLVRAGDYAQAEKLMIRLSRETEPDLASAAAWAASELPKLRKTRQEVRAGRQEMYNTAVRFMKSHDYEQAAQLLEEYPYDLRTPKMQELLESAERKSEEVHRLRREVKTLRGRADNKAIIPVLETLLELKPGDRRAKELLERLTRRQSGPITKILGRQTPSFLDGLSALAQTAILAVLVIVPTSVAAYQWSDYFLKSPTESSIDIVDGEISTQDVVSDTDADMTSGKIRSATTANDNSAGVSARPSAAFSSARPLRNLNNIGTVNAYPWISPDGLTIWWTREGSEKTSGIYQATRATINDEFGGGTLVLSGARHGTLTADGLTMIALSRDDGGQLLNPGLFRRASSGVPFSSAPEDPVIGDTANPKSFAFSNADRDLIYSDRSAGYDLFKVSRTTSEGDWGSPEVIRATGALSSSGTLFGWGSLTADREFLLHTQASESNLRNERAYLSVRSADGVYGDPESIVIDGDESLPIRSPRFCEASGELFYTLGTGPLNSPFSRTEIWVASIASGANAPAKPKPQPSPNAAPDRSPAASQPQWTSLLDGDLSFRWQRYSGGPISSRWAMVNGVLTLRPPSGKKRGTEGIVTKASYQNFELEFEWKVNQSANGGIVYLVQMGLENAYKSGPEYQILDDVAKRSVTSVKTVSGSVFGLAPVSGTRPKAVGQWNSGKIVKDDRRLTHWLNGVKAAEIVIDGPEWRRSLAEREMKNWPRFCKTDSGRIELQDLGGGVSFRNLRIRSLDSSPVTASSQSINLIDLIQPSRDVVSGKFQVSNGKLRTPPNDRSVNHSPLLMLPFTPSNDNYRIELEIERKSDSGYGCNFGVVVGGHQAVIAMDGSSNVSWGMEIINGYSIHAPQNKTVTRGKRLTRGAIVSVDIHVTGNSVKVDLEGQPIIDWTGRPEQLSVWERVAPKLTNRRQLFLYSQAEFLIHKLDVTIID